MAETWWKGINAECWVEIESRIHVELKGKFLQGFPAEFLGIFGGFIEHKK